MIKLILKLPNNTCNGSLVVYVLWYVLNYVNSIFNITKLLLFPEHSGFLQKMNVYWSMTCNTYSWLYLRYCTFVILTIGEISTIFYWNVNTWFCYLRFPEYVINYKTQRHIFFRYFWSIIYIFDELAEFS